MPKTVNPIRKAKVKQSLLNNKSARQALKDNGYSNAVAHKSTTNAVVKVCMKEILSEIKESDITIIRILRNIIEDRELARLKNDIGTMKECDALLGKYLAMFTDKVMQEGNAPPSIIDNTVHIHNDKKPTASRLPTP